MVVDLGIGIEGTREDELPEAILCQTRYDRVDLDGGAALLASTTGVKAAGSAGGDQKSSAGKSSASAASPK
jgi:hypothetical protein